MNKKLTVLLALFIPLLLTMSCASATYYYTDAYFKENFGKAVKAAPTTGLKHGVMTYTDSDAFTEKFGKSPAGKKQKELPETPSKPVVPEEPKIVLEEETVPVVVVPLELPKNETDSGIAVVPSPEESEVKTEDEKANWTAIAPAVVSEEGGVPIQITVIGFLIVVIVIMLVILLTGKEKPKKDDWVEGDFFKEAKEKGDKKAETRMVSIKAGPKLESAKPNDKRGDVKPFLLKIKDEI